MFSKSYKNNRPQGMTHTLALPAPAAPVSIISADIVVNGDIRTVSEILIDGTITGNLRAAKITVGQQATIRGDIVAEEVIVCGHVVGTIAGRRVQLSGTSFVEGDVHHQSMGMEMGARLDGSCRHSADPLALVAAAPVGLPKPSLARAALKTEERSGLALAAAPKPDLAAALSEAGLNKGAPEADARPEPVKPTASGLDDLKGAGMKMRVRASKPASPAKKPAAEKIGEELAAAPSDAAPAFEPLPRQATAG